jgi:Ni,Fe-hydrogenase I small subunit
MTDITNSSSCPVHGTEDVRTLDDVDYCGTCLNLDEDDPRAAYGTCGGQGCLRCEG